MNKINDFKIASSMKARNCFETNREIVDIHTICNLNEIAAIVLSHEDVSVKMMTQLIENGLNIPIFAVINRDEKINTAMLSALTGVFSLDGKDTYSYSNQLEAAAQGYESGLLPPFFKTLTQYLSKRNITFACPGHQGIDFFCKHPSGQKFVDFFGENIFLADVPHADPMLGDILSHEGAPGEAQKHAAKVFNADRTYFVLNGTSASNKVVANALLTPGDIVLFDRNNHKSCYHGALIQAGAIPVYLETTRNSFGLIGGIPAHCFEEDYLRQLLGKVSPEKANAPRPFRLAIIQLGTYDGTIYNAHNVVNKIGHLCDYILFDSAWVGYEQFIPIMKDCSPLLLELNENSPGIIVTQSVHKQQAGFSQTSQIHKKDNHLKEQSRYCNHKRFNHAFMLHASTSPFYPLFSALDVNAKIHSKGSGQKLWSDCIRIGIEARKILFSSCKLIKPFVQPFIENRPWQSYDTETIATDLRFFSFDPDEKWHTFEGYEKSQYCIDPCKLLLTTPGVDPANGKYSDFGIPAIFLASYLRENGIIPEKCDLNSIIFLLTPAISNAKVQHLVTQIIQFEKHIEQDSMLSEVLPTIYYNNYKRYRNYTIRQLCQEMHNLYSSYDIKELQRNMFRERHFPHVVLNPQDANIQLIRGNVDLIPIAKSKGKIAAEGALPYPPGILCIAPGEIWDGAVLDYFLALEELINILPSFAPEMQGVYINNDSNGRKRIYGYVLRN
ncbi:ornithine decarboxylase [Photorhabdus temperata]|uniref:ornithine decarboxylase n=1 Tax=Photorhabdus temperata subsp. temperata Meg1 TaxID=1393735 RepID=A0A081RW94_PHOTE|nr:ornithine decarboxylase [Photorhabdus temperata]KER02947.1 arginine/lysine/ornithine decarboxylase [Photorhabdus temperata subsp. temperata Meg1]MCT8347730.1 ornithine decarboxylase [Photorhabdus temperata]